MRVSQEQTEQWAWQRKQYAEGEDPIDEWRKRRASGQISDLENQYGDPKEVGGIPLPMASFGVGGEFGVGGKYDNGGRFDLRLPYAEQVRRVCCLAMLSIGLFWSRIVTVCHTICVMREMECVIKFLNV